MRLRERGLTLTETIISVFILALVFSAIISLYPNSAILIRQQEEHTFANDLADSILAEELARPFQEHQIGKQPPVIMMEEGLSYSYQVEVRNVPKATRQDLIKELRVTVSWRTRDKDYGVVKGVYAINIKR